MKRRLIIARALVNDPDIFDLGRANDRSRSSGQTSDMGKIRELKKNGVTVILSTHYMDEAEQLCDRLVIMERGKILVEGSPKIDPRGGRRMCHGNNRTRIRCGVEVYLNENKLRFERLDR